MPRKTEAVELYRRHLRGASMRPRPDAAENPDGTMLPERPGTLQ